jgi:hypothetical protein
MTISSKKFRAVMVLLVGVGIATVTDFHANIFGTIMGAVAVALTSYSQVLMNHLQMQHSLDAWQTMGVISPQSFGILLFAAAATESFGPSGLLAHSWTQRELMLIVLSSLMAIASNFFGFAIIKSASPLTYQVVGHTKTCLTVLTGVLIFTPMEPASLNYILRTTIGLIVAIAGLLMFSAAPPDAPSISPSQQSGDPSKFTKFAPGSDAPFASSVTTQGRLLRVVLILAALAVAFMGTWAIFGNADLSPQTIAYGTLSRGVRKSGGAEATNAQHVCPTCAVCAPLSVDCAKDCAAQFSDASNPTCFDNLHKKDNQKETIGVVYVLGLRSPMIEAYRSK